MFNSPTTPRLSTPLPYRPPTTPKRLLLAKVDATTASGPASFATNHGFDSAILIADSVASTSTIPSASGFPPTATSESRSDKFMRRSRSGSVRCRRKSWDDLRLPVELLSTSTPKDADPLIMSSVEQDRQGEQEVLQSFRYPFAQSAQLLRRCNSVGEALADIDDEDDEDAHDDADDFSSEDESFKGPRRPPSLSSLSSQRSSRYRIQLEDQSHRQTNAFASDACIRAFYAVGGKSSGYVVFLVEVKTKEGPMIRIPKRFSSFVRLRSDLIGAFPRFKSIIPRLPPKSSLAKFRLSFLDHRRKHLSFWLATILLHSEMGGSGIVRAWVLE